METTETPTVFYIEHPHWHGLGYLLTELPTVPLHNLWDLLRWTFRRKPRPLLIAVDSFGKWGALACLASVLWRAPMVLWVNGEYFKEQREVLLAQRGVLRWFSYVWRLLAGWMAFSKARLIVPNSAHILGTLPDRVKGKAGAIVHPPFRRPASPETSVPPSSLPAAGVHLLTVMNLDFSSKTELTREAIASWLAPAVYDEMNVTWALCGDGLQMASFRAAICEAGLQERVKLLGKIDNVAAAYEWCHVLVHLTRLDAFPRVVMEAHAAGKPVITNSDSCGVREQVFHEETGLVVDGPTAFEAAVRRYAADSELARRHGENGRRQVESSFLIEHQRVRMSEQLRRLNG